MRQYPLARREGNGFSRRDFLKVGGAGLAAVTLGGFSGYLLQSETMEHEQSAHLALTPPMGWNSWNQFGRDIDEKLVRAIADSMVESGMRDAGYEYLVVDGGWPAPDRDANGNMQIDYEKFPSGMEALVSYIHGKGLKVGVHQPMGMTNCSGDSPGTQSAPDNTFAGKARRDAETLAGWGIDYIKFDRCEFKAPEGADEGEKESSMIEAFEAMSKALDDTGRPIVYSINSGGSRAEKAPWMHFEIEPWSWAPDIGANLWRIQNDIRPTWSTGNDGENRGPSGVIEEINVNTHLAPYAGPGHWNDMDALEVGVAGPGSSNNPDEPEFPGLTPQEERSHFSMWAMMASPLIAAADLREMSETTREILTNEEVIAVNQDPRGIQGERIRRDGDQEVWVKPLENDDRAVILFNRGEETTSMSTGATEIGMRKAPAYLVRDLWEHKQRASKDEIRASVPSHGVAMFRVQPKGPEKRVES